MASGPVRDWPKVRALPYDHNRTPGWLIALRVLLYPGLMLSLVFGTPVVRVAGGGALALALLADWDGAVRHVSRLAGLVLASCLSPWWGMALGSAVLKVWAMPPLLAHTGGIILVAAVLMGLCSLAGRRMTRALQERPKLRAANHAFGMLAGTTEGVALVAAACWMVGVFAVPLASVHDRLGAAHRPVAEWLFTQLTDTEAAVRADPAGPWLMRVNPLDDVPAIQGAQLAAELAADPGRFVSALNDGRLGSLAELPEVKPYLEVLGNDEALRRALREGDLAAVLSNPYVNAMARDRALHAALLAHRDELRRVLDQPVSGAVSAAERGAAEPPIGAGG